MTSKQATQTRQIEMVETHNLALSIKRLKDAPGDSNKWRRALYHALAMSYIPQTELENIRKSIELP